MLRFRYSPTVVRPPALTLADGFILLALAALFYAGVRLAFHAPRVIQGPEVSLSAAALPWYALLSLARMAAAYVLSLLFSLDQLVWRPLLAWADKFKVETVQGDSPPRSWFYDLMSRSVLVERLSALMAGWSERLDATIRDRYAKRPVAALEPVARDGLSWRARAALAVFATCVLYGAWRAAVMLAQLAPASWTAIGLGTGATFLRVALALALTLVWTVPVGVAIGTNRRLAQLLQPVVQVIASVPATAVFPVLVLVLVRAPGGLNTVSTLLMLLGTQWYLLFNVIAGAAAIPQDLRDTTALLRLDLTDRWRVLVLPALFPFLITGSITASGGAWNASIVAEHVEFGGQTHATLGVGALIADATGRGDYPMLLGSTLALVAAVILINRRVWRRLYRLAEERYRME